MSGFVKYNWVWHKRSRFIYVNELSNWLYWFKVSIRQRLFEHLCITVFFIYYDEYLSLIMYLDGRLGNNES
jgi:hypothetical protein